MMTRRRIAVHHIIVLSFLALSALLRPGGQPVAAAANPDQIVYGVGTEKTPHYRLWNGTGYGDSAPAQTANDTVRWVVIKSSPTADEMVMGVLSSRNKELHVQTWNGSTWVSNWSSTTKSESFRSFDIAYEQDTGDVLVVFGDTNNNLKYRKRTGGTWDSADQTVLALDDVANYVRLESPPTGDDLFVATVTNASSLYALRWDGSIDAWGDQVTIAGIANKATECFDIAFERISGDALLIWADDASNVKYKEFTTSWQPEGIAYSSLSDLGQWLVAAHDPSSDSSKIAIGVLTKGNTFEFGAWDGSDWLTRPAAIAARVKDNRGIDVAFEKDTGKALYIFNQSTSATQLAWRTWTSTDGFSDVTVEAGSSNLINFMQLKADPDGNEVMALYSDITSGLYYRTWNGSSWSALGPALESNLSATAKGEPFMYAWYPPSTTAVTLASFVAAPADQAILLEWETASEIDNAGFDLYQTLYRFDLTPLQK